MSDKLRVEDPARLFFTSDTHFFHKAVIKFCNRPYASVDEMTEGMVEIWNSTVALTDLVVHMGDFCFGKIAQARELLPRLNGIIHLVKGNHDHSDRIDKALIHRCESVNSILRITVVPDNQYIVCCHYPILVWDQGHHGSWHLHGHCHGWLDMPETTRLDVGWDAWGKPISYAEVKAIMANREYIVYDHHSTKESND